MPEAKSLNDALLWAGSELRPIAGDMAGLDARLLLCHATGFSREQLISKGHEPVSHDAAGKFDGLIARRQTGESVARIIGTKEFWSLPFALGPETLEPRPDSECIVEALLDVVPDRNAALRVLDLGTGSGCLLLALLSELPNASGVGVDVAAGALDVATRNAKQLGIADRATFLQSDWLEEVDGMFDLAITNPPYITDDEMATLDQNVRGIDPERALCGGADGLDAYRSILKGLPKHLNAGAHVAMESSPQLIAALEAMLAENPQNRDIVIINDLAGKQRGLRYRNGH